MKDWTRDELTGRSNSSTTYLRLVEIVTQLILGGAHSLLAGDVVAVARCIVSTLAFKHNIGPREAFEDDDRYVLGRSAMIDNMIEYLNDYKKHFLVEEPDAD